MGFFSPGEESSCGGGWLLMAEAEALDSNPKPGSMSPKPTPWLPESISAMEVGEESIRCCCFAGSSMSPMIQPRKVCSCPGEAAESESMLSQSISSDAGTGWSSGAHSSFLPPSSPAVLGHLKVVFPETAATPAVSVKRAAPPPRGEDRVDVEVGGLGLL
ncbi:hypothetical protein IEQ34_022344 [Dendrobium chrysotoxum]|uniref:Uncharacterized protein n=1 Tax=Dendrobium chrysotoxum TaxID=161865 RepID=A0AAV7FK43_DENCH|nr:hypothetical protein IEQ34_022344 [Dendrobium chrysotoxum]